MMHQFPEIGYTPANLRYLLSQLGWSQTEAARQLGVSDRSVRGWVAETGAPAHSDMPLARWQKLFAMLPEN